jgi:CRP/FNR family transcriptional regulator, cyclic AMP receptor protein
MSDRQTVDFLATVPLFAGADRADLVELAGAMRRRTAREGEVLWRQGEEPREMLFIAGGGVSVSLRAAGGRAVEIARAGPGEMIGELALIDGGPHTMSVSVTEDATLLALGRQDFAALLGRQHPSAFSVKRRLAALFTARLRNSVRHLEGALGDEENGPPAAAAVRAPADLEYCSPPDSTYLRRMATFHDFDRLAVWGFLTSGRYARCAPGHTLLAEGAPSTACFLTINGAVEKVMVRGERRIRAGLAGPGKAFGYESLVDGGPSPVTAIARERALLLVLSRDPFERLFTAEDAISRVFLDVILRDMASTLRETLSPLARRAWSGPV